eukprot:1160564-Pelagomonas_calceolata.AAC.15
MPIHAPAAAVQPVAARGPAPPFTPVSRHDLCLQTLLILIYASAAAAQPVAAYGLTQVQDPI